MYLVIMLFEVAIIDGKGLGHCNIILTNDLVAGNIWICQDGQLTFHSHISEEGNDTILKVDLEFDKRS